MNEYDVAMMACAVVCVVMTAWINSSNCRRDDRKARKLSGRLDSLMERVDALEESVDSLLWGAEDEGEDGEP